MIKSFSDLAQANVNFYNEHRTAHTVITVAYTVAAIVAVNSIIKLAAKNPQTIVIYYPTK